MTTRNERLEAGKRFLEAAKNGTPMDVLRALDGPVFARGIRPRCPVCHKRIRGLDHTKGRHHKEAQP